MSYSSNELSVLTYVVNFYESNNFKFIAPLIRAEFENIRSESAYCSRLYKLKKEFELLQNQNEVYKKLNICNPLLKAILKPEQYETKENQELTPEITVEIDVKSEFNLDLIKAEHESFKLDMKNKFKKWKIDISKKDKELYKLKNELKKTIVDLKLTNDKLNILKTKVEKNLEEEEEKRSEITDEELEIEKIAQREVDKIWEDVMREPLGPLPEAEVKLDDELLKHINQLEDEMLPRTTSVWKENQRQNPPLHYYVVESETEEHLKYKVKFDEKNNTYFCDCPSWKYQRFHPKHRSCKHIIAIRGKDAEKQRVLENGGIWYDKKTRFKKDKTTKNTTKKTNTKKLI